MSPRAHESHYSDPAQALMKQFIERLIIRDCGDSVGKKINFVALLSYQSPDQQIIRRTVFNRGVAAKGLKSCASCCNRRTQCKFHSIQLLRYKNSGIEV